MKRVISPRRRVRGPGLQKLAGRVPSRGASVDVVYGFHHLWFRVSSLFRMSAVGCWICDNLRARHIRFQKYRVAPRLGTHAVRRRLLLNLHSFNEHTA